jgi:hypothetical protein
MALSDAATWGSQPSVDTVTDVPSTSDELSEFDNHPDEEDEFDDDYAVHGGNEHGVADPFPDTKSTSDPAAEKDNRDNQDADVEGEAEQPPRTKRRRCRKKRWLKNIIKYNPHFEAIVASVIAPEQHAELVDKEAMQQVVKEEGKVIVPASQVRTSVGPQLERWKLAAESELTKNFQNTHAMHKSTPEEIKQHGRPLPMLCVWSKQESEDYAKCRACVCGNFASVDPTMQSWTAQAEPSSLIASLKVGRVNRWRASKHDVKGAFLNAKLPEGDLSL